MTSSSSKPKDIPFGKALLRVRRVGDEYVGIIVGQSKKRFDGPDEATVVAKMRAEVSAQTPGFVGLSGARERFLTLFPGGFGDPAYVGDTKIGERAYKLAASEQLRRTLPLGSSATAPGAGEHARRVVAKLNLIDMFSKAKLSDVLRGPRSIEFLSICEEFAEGETERACVRLNRTFVADGVASWVCLTYLPFLWRPDRHMFLKPSFTRSYAERIGHPFQHDYESVPNAATYESLLAMTAESASFLEDLEPGDNIDIHSFMWVVMSYPDIEAAADAVI